MTSPLMIDQLCGAKPGVGVLTELEGGERVLRPLADGREVVLNLTPFADHWLEVVDANDKVYDHVFPDKEQGSDKIGTQALHIVVRLPRPAGDGALLELFERDIKKAVGCNAVRSTEGFAVGKMWIDMHRGEGTVILNLLLSGTSSLTALRFI